MKLQIDVDDKILILAPHPDDESIGCGGVLCQYAKQCDVIVLTDGGLGNPEWTYEKTVQERKNEFESAMKSLQVNSYQMLNLKDSQLSKNKWGLLKINVVNYAYIFVPNKYEKHSDHACIYNIIKLLKIINRSEIRIVEYEVWTPIRKPTHFIDITDYEQRKRQLISFYQCQLKHINYADRILALNQYRGIYYNVDYAECFCIHSNLPQLYKNFMEIGRRIGEKVCWKK